MAPDPQDDKRHLEARAVLRDAVEYGNVPLQPEEAQTLVDAITTDLAAASEETESNRDRLHKLETQTRVLSDAIVAITDGSVSLAPAIRAVKDEM